MRLLVVGLSLYVRHLFKMNRFWARQNCGDDLFDLRTDLFVRTFRTYHPEFRQELPTISR